MFFFRVVVTVDRSIPEMNVLSDLLELIHVSLAELSRFRCANDIPRLA